MTFNHSATTRRYRWSGPTRTPLCWTQPMSLHCSRTWRRPPIRRALPRTT